MKIAFDDLQMRKINYLTCLKMASTFCSCIPGCPIQHLQINQIAKDIPQMGYKNLFRRQTMLFGSKNSFTRNFPLIPPKKQLIKIEEKENPKIKQEVAKEIHENKKEPEEVKVLAKLKSQSESEEKSNKEKSMKKRLEKSSLSVSSKSIGKNSSKKETSKEVRINDKNTNCFQCNILFFIKFS